MSLKKMVIVLLSVCCVSVGFCEEAQKQPDPYAETSVLVEAFVVRISTEALTQAGVSPIGQAPDGISLLKIISCMDDPDQARVLSGAKVNGRHKHEAQVRDRRTHYIKREKIRKTQSPQGPVETKDTSYNNYDSGVNFEARSYIKSQGTVSFEYSFSVSAFEESKDGQSPPGAYGFDWSGVVTAQSGEPIIAGGGQDGESVTLLILCATIQQADES